MVLDICSTPISFSKEKTTPGAPFIYSILRANEGQLSEHAYEDKIKEAFRQMGIELE